MSRHPVTERTVVVISAGIGKPSATRLLADRLATATVAELDQPNDPAAVSVEVVELREYAQDITNAMLTGFPNRALSEVSDKVTAADGLIAVTPVFTASFSGLFKSFFDVLDQRALEGKPVLIAATGGTERHTLVLEHAMRPMFSYLRAVVVPTSVYAASSDWGTNNAKRDGHGGSRPADPTGDAASGTGGDSAELGRRVTAAGAELAALIRNGKRSPQSDPYDDPTPFEQLLKQN